MDCHSTSPSLPALLSVEDLIKSRAQEFRRLNFEINTLKPQNKRSFQRLSKWNRRRAQSHNPYRIPRAYRGGIVRELERAIPKRSRRPRRDTRRSRNVLTRYHTRSTKVQWLNETHLWHAKRFHMRNMWKYRLAFEACEKQKRRVYRYASQKCIAHDRSYIEVLKVSGDLLSLKTLFSMLNPSAPEVMFSASAMQGGYRQQIYLFSPRIKQSDSSPPDERDGVTMGRLIGPVQFLWASSAIEEQGPCVWLLCHPSITAEIHIKLQYGAEHLMHHPTCALRRQTELCVRVHKMNVGSLFELSGRLSLSAIMSTLRIDDSTSQSEGNGKEQNTARIVWDILRPFACEDPPVPNGAVIPLRVKVPVVLGPFPSVTLCDHRRTPNEKELERLHSLLLSWPANKLGEESRKNFFSTSNSNTSNSSSQKLIFRSRKRKMVRNLIERLKSLQKSYRSLIKSKGPISNPLVVSETSVKSAFPPKQTLFEKGYITVLIIRRCENCVGNGSYNGYDILFTRNSGASRFWTLLMRRIACAIGVNDRHGLFTNAGVPYFPWDFPETHAGQLQALEDGRRLASAYNSVPPSKRVNYAALGIAYPFCPRWSLLVDQMHRSQRNNILHNPLTEYETVCLYSVRSSRMLSVWDYPCTIGQHSFAFPSPPLWTVGHCICALLLLNDPEKEQALLEGLENRDGLGTVLIAVRVFAASSGIPSSRSHLYCMESPSVDQAISEQAIQMHYLWEIWKPFPPRVSKRVTKSPMLCLPVNKQFKSKKRRKQRNGTGEMFDELGQLGMEAPDACNLVGFITSGCQSFRYGHGVGLGCVTLRSFLKVLVTLCQVVKTKCCSSIRNHFASNLRKILSIKDTSSSTLALLGDTVLLKLFLPVWYQPINSSVRKMGWMGLPPRDTFD